MNEFKKLLWCFPYFMGQPFYRTFVMCSLVLIEKKKKIIKIKAETAEDTMFIIYKDLDFHWFY